MTQTKENKMNNFKFNTFARLLTGLHVTILKTDEKFCWVHCPTQKREFWIHENNLKEF
jgi:hypothetical protein